MKLKNIDIIGIISSLHDFSQKKLPQKVSYAITKNQLKLDREIECYQTELQKLFSKYNDHISKDENGEYINNSQGIPEFKEESVVERNEFIGELNELLSIENDVDLYLVDDELLNYDDNGVYDVLTPSEISYLYRVLCKK